MTVTVESETPRRMLKIAFEFYHTASIAAHEDVDAPVVVNYAFSIEVYLKLLLLLTGRGVVQTHDLLKLFGKLDDATREKLLAHYPGTSDADLLRDEFTDCAKAFKEWRYAYEHEALGILMGPLRNLPIALCRTIKEVKPELVSDYEKGCPSPVP